MNNGEGVDGELAGDDSEGGGDDLPNPDPTFDSQGGDDDGAADDGTDDGDAGDDMPVDPDDGNGSDEGDGETGGDAGETGGDAGDTGGDTGTGGSDDGQSATDEGGSTGSLDILDVSGWTIMQTDSPRTFELPANTLLVPGDTIVIGRNATQSQFESYWGVSLGAQVQYLSGGDEFPVINGLETYTIEDDLGAVVDGPTPAMLAGDNQQRDDAAMAGDDPVAWTVSTESDATPGLAATSPASDAALVITEVSDATGNGSYIYEFVELTYVAP